MTTGIPNCAQCGGTVAPDGRCWDCGAAQPAFRARLEAAVAGAAAVSDRGLRKELNADAFALATAGEWAVGVVCDGVSMAPRADRAAQVAAEVGARALAALLREGALPETALADSTARAARAVAALAPGGGADTAPACTYVAGVAGPGGLWCAGVGDSRAYWLPESGPGMALTEDDTGELDALTAWLGAGADAPEVRVRSYRPSVRGRLLLCTDGLWRHLPHPDALRAALPRPPADGELPAARALVARALDAGGEDNITVLLLPLPCRPDRPVP